MSIEPTCLYCNTTDKFRCRSQEEANECRTYQRRQAVMEEVRKGRRDEGFKPETKPVTVEEIDRAIDTLKRVKQQLGAPDD